MGQQFRDQAQNFGDFGSGKPPRLWDHLGSKPLKVLGAMSEPLGSCGGGLGTLGAYIGIKVLGLGGSK